MKNLEQPKIDVEKIQQAAIEGAEKAYLNAIRDYYTGYNSPYVKMIADELIKLEFSFNLELPDILARINVELKNEVDRIANEAIATTYIPLLTRTLVKIDKKIKMSWVFEEIISEITPDFDDRDRFSFSFDEDKKYKYLNCILSTSEGEYEFTLHTVYDTEKTDNVKYHLLRLPSTSTVSQHMEIKKNDVVIKMPFTPVILNDPVLRLFFKMILSKCEIEMDCDNFEDWMFEDDE